MCIRLPIVSLAVVSLVSGTALPARAGFTIYTDQASFLAALNPNPFLDTYNDLPGGSLGSPLNRSGNGFSYTASTRSRITFFVAGTSADRWLSLSNVFALISYDTFGGSPTAVGGFFFGIDGNGDLLPGPSITVMVTGSDGTLSETLTHTSTATFFGVVGTGPITDFNVFRNVPAGSANLAGPTVNDFIVGRGAPPPSVVPAPPGLALGLLGAATAGLGLLRRRRA